MRILHVIPYASPIYGGPCTAVRQMVDVLTGGGVEIDVATTTANGGEELDVPLGKPVEEGGARFYYFRRQSPKFWMFSWGLKSWVEERAREYDLIHVHGLFAYTTLPACAAARRAGKPYVITPHGVLDPWCLAHKWWKKWPYYYLLEQKNLAGAAAIHVTSAFEADGLARLGFGDKARIIPLSVNLREPAPRLACTDKPLSLLFLSRLDPIKGLPILLEAMALLKERGRRDCSLEVVGDGSPDYKAKILALVNQLGLSENVRFAGFLQGEAKARVFATADIFLLPSYHENFGLAAAEAMAEGLPVIITDRVGLAEEVKKAGAGIVVPAGDAIALAGAIEQLSRPELRCAMAEKARKLVENKFSKAALQDRLMGLYRSAMANDHG